MGGSGPGRIGGGEGGIDGGSGGDAVVCSAKVAHKDIFDSTSKPVCAQIAIACGFSPIDSQRPVRDPMILEPNVASAPQIRVAHTHNANHDMMHLRCCAEEFEFLQPMSSDLIATSARRGAVARPSVSPANSDNVGQSKALPTALLCETTISDAMCECWVVARHAS